MFLLGLIILVILFFYALLIIRYAFGWSKIKRIPKGQFFPNVSVVIAMRNEEDQINDLIAGLQSQIYPKDKLEFILVNDHSSDNTLSLLEKYALTNLKILDMPEGEYGKKDAISMAVSIARGEIILASDADCGFSPNWVHSMVSYFINDNVKLVSGPVVFNSKEGVFQSLQALEFASLIGSGAGAIGINNAIFCNGANMAYRKEVFLEVNSFGNDSVVSGDDVFLLHSVKAKCANSIVFAKEEKAIVNTNSLQTFRDFVNQRKRWAAKASRYKDIESIYVSYLVFFTNAALIFLFVMLFFDVFFLYLFVIFYAIKFFVDQLLLYPTLTFLNRKYLIKWIFPFEFFYSFYIILIVFFSFTRNFEWKGRMHKK